MYQANKHRRNDIKLSPFGFLMKWWIRTVPITGAKTLQEGQTFLKQESGWQSPNWLTDPSQHREVRQPASCASGIRMWSSLCIQFTGGTTGMQSTESRLWETLQHNRPCFFTKKKKKATQEDGKHPRLSAGTLTGVPWEVREYQK